jgi:hypothetical protein
MSNLIEQISSEAALGPLPNFVGIGAQRAATTWLHECLAEHPDVFVPQAKELNFFVKHFEQGTEWYRKQFAGYSGESAIGEITPTYLGDRDALPRIANTLPDAKLFVVLRNPFERTYSAYQLFRDRFHWRTFREALETSEMLIAHSLYSEHVRCALDLFPADRLRVFLYDDIEASPNAVLKDLFSFLDVDPTFIPPSISKRYNSIIFPRAQRLLTAVGLRWAVSLVKKSPLAEIIKRKSRPVKRISRADLEYLSRRFLPDIAALELLIDRDLSHWVP